MASADRITRHRSDAAAGEDQRFSGRVAIVTGSTADPSIGRSCAFRLAREGASVVINGRDEDRVASTEAALRAEGLAAVGVVGSMDTEAAVAHADGSGHGGVRPHRPARQHTGRRPLSRSPSTAISEEQLLETFRLNTWPGLALIRAALARGLGDNAGSIVTISSGSPRKTTSAMVSYASAKAALNAMTRTMAADLAEKGVRVNAVSPGLVRTTATRPIWKGDDGAARGRGSPSGPADRSRGHRGGGVLPSLRRRPADHRDHPGRRRWEPPLERLDADPLTTGTRTDPGQKVLQRCDDSRPDAGDLLPHLLGCHAGKLHPEVESVGADFAHRCRQAAPPSRPAHRTRSSGPHRTRSRRSA